MLKKLHILMFLLCLLPAGAFAKDDVSTFDRVIAKNTIRCGYYLWPPMLEKDVKTNAFSGVAYDTMEEVGKRLGIKIEWTEEAGLDTLLQGLSGDRYDMVCAPLYALGTRARAAFFTTPLFYTPLYVVVRDNDHRFDKNLSIVNDPSFKVAVLEGEATAILAAQRLPKATLHAVPQMQGYGFVLKDVSMGKADITFSDEVSIADFNRNNKEKLRLLKVPFVVNAAAFPVAQDIKLKEMISTSIDELMRDGWFINLLETKYPDFKRENFMVAPPYEFSK